MCVRTGVEVPSKDSVPKKKPVYTDKRRKKPNTTTPEGSNSPDVVVALHLDLLTIR